MVDLYYFEPPNANSGKPYLTLLEKGVEFTRREISFLDFEQHSPAYLKINPKGQVPTLIHEGRVITESTPMGEYIDQSFAGPSLIPADPLERWRMRCWSKYLDVDFGPALSMIAWSRFVGPMMRARHGARAETVIGNVPTQERKIAWSTAIHGTFTEEQLAESGQRLARCALKVEGSLSQRPWIAGNTYSLADINLYNFFAPMPMFLPDMVNPSVSPHTMAWLQRMAQRPAVKQMQAESKPAPWTR
jgi:GSH-dependent disulfide-bond oxidoreductase